MARGLLAASLALLAVACSCYGASTPPNAGATVGAGIETVVPWGASNLPPFQALWNSNLCFYFNQSTACPPNYLNQTGKIYLSTPQKTAQFCSPSCLNRQFNQTLTCIYLVTKYNQTITWKFTSGATLYQLNHTAQIACANVTAGLTGNFTVAK